MGVSAPAIQHAYSVLTVKAVDEENRLIEGIASTPEVDRVGDIVEPNGAEFKLPIPLLWQHRSDQPIGQVTSARITKSGIHIRAQIAKGLLPRIDEAWALIKAGLVRGLSIGFHAKETARIEGGFGMRFLKWEWLELSAVTIPANADASIQTIKSLDAASRAVSGTRASVSSSSGVPDKPSKGRTMHLPVSEQIKSLEEERQQQADRLKELIDKDDAELTDEETKERDGLTASIESKASKLKSLKALESTMVEQADPVRYSPAIKREPRIHVTDHAKELPKGTLFTRYALAVAAGRGSYSDTLAYAKRWDSQTPEVSAYIKAVAGGTIDQSPGWGSQLIPSRTLVSEFVDLLRSATVLGRLQGTRSAPTRVNVQVQTGGSTFEWVGEGGVKPVGELDFTTLAIGEHKVAGIIVLTEELVRNSSPSAEELARRDLTEQAARFIDVQFLTPSVAVGASNPASITNGVTSPAASGTDADALYVDLNTALATFDGADMGTETVHIITTPAIARGISTLRNALGMREFPDMTPTGGTLLGFPVIVSNSVPSGHLILVKANEIFVAGDGSVRLDASNQATLDMAGGASPTFNLWQRNCIGIRAEQFITWVKRRADVVAVIDTASYGPSVGS